VNIIRHVIRVFVLWSAIILGIVAIAEVHAEEPQQSNVSATPASIVLPSPLPLMTQAATTPTSTYSPSPIAPVLLEALTEANVRAEPDPESELLGTIRAGDVYAVIGRYFRWYQFQFDESRSGTGWVFDELVTITGDETAILDLSENAVPTADNTALAATNMAEAITQTPGGILTATAGALVIPFPVETSSTNDSLNFQQSSAAAALPTFTYPPDVPAIPPDSAFQVGTVLAATPTLTSSNLSLSSGEGVPPILPILVLGGAGLLGLAVTVSRR